MKLVYQFFVFACIFCSFLVINSNNSNADFNGQISLAKYNHKIILEAKKKVCAKKKKKCKAAPKNKIDPNIKPIPPHPFQVACCNKTTILHIDGYTCDKDARTADGGCKICGGVGSSDCVIDGKGKTTCGKCK